MVVELDGDPRIIEIPTDLSKEFKKDKQAKAIFDKLSYTHRREYVKWIEEAKRAETRQTRILKTIEMLRKRAVNLWNILVIKILDIEETKR